MQVCLLFDMDLVQPDAKPERETLVFPKIENK